MKTHPSGKPFSVQADAWTMVGIEISQPTLFSLKRRTPALKPRGKGFAQGFREGACVPADLMCRVGEKGIMNQTGKVLSMGGKGEVTNAEPELLGGGDKVGHEDQPIPQLSGMVEKEDVSAVRGRFHSEGSLLRFARRHLVSGKNQRRWDMGFCGVVKIRPKKFRIRSRENSSGGRFS